ncbi:MAG: hypothetical protein CVV64_00405 [Candidatus Wallbacteria bacterium HGW-Wallbacteria-1]|jgi:tetratricopeptide (TPR) repeat protein|uniref:Uncharacterized protein n=1 Tax=Candidatus Wallbacteria bacterium HGW-Wallbacteria-1 TaxID=2013854 RepID=A0A2N1PUF4_9BACT|nr:MAG: hypothetical protein CVV64_00405 [Candidatus Wallbacteria bacterium HGW-Wallbacteria-1]
MSSYQDLFEQAERAREEYDFETALSLYTQGIQVINRVPETPETRGAKLRALTMVGEILWMKGATQKAVDIYLSALKIAEDADDKPCIITIALDLGNLYQVMNNTKMAVVYLERAMELSRESGDPVSFGRALYLSGIVSGKEGEKDRAEELLAAAEESLAGVAGDIAALNVLAGVAIQRGLSSFRRGEYDDAIRHYVGALNICSATSSSLEKGEAYRYLGVIHSIKRNYIETLRNHGQALKIFKTAGYVFGMAKVYSSIGQTYLGIEDLDRAIYFLKKAAKLYVELKSNSDLAAIYSKLGDVYRLMKKYDLAIKYYLKDLKISREMENQHGLAYTYMNLGTVYRLMNETAQAHTYLSRSIELFEKFDDQRNIASVYYELALAYIEASDFEQGKDFADLSMELFEKTGRKVGAANVGVLYGMMCKGLGHWDEAAAYFEKSIVELQEINATQDVIAGCYEMGRMYVEKGDQAQALSFFRKAYQLAANVDIESLMGKCLDEIEQIDEGEVIEISIERMEKSGVPQG